MRLDIVEAPILLFSLLHTIREPVFHDVRLLLRIVVVPRLQALLVVRVRVVEERLGPRGTEDVVPRGPGMLALPDVRQLVNEELLVFFVATHAVVAVARMDYILAVA